MVQNFRGNAYNIKAYDVPIASRTAKGIAITQLLPISRNETITSLVAVNSFNEDDFLIIMTSQGIYDLIQ